MSRDRFALIEGGKGRKPKRSKAPPTCGRCKGRLYTHGWMPTEQSDGSPGKPRRYRVCLSCLSAGRVELF